MVYVVFPKLGSPSFGALFFQDLVVQVLVAVPFFQNLVVQVVVYVVFSKTWLSKFWFMLFFPRLGCPSFGCFPFFQTWLSKFMVRCFFRRLGCPSFGLCCFFQDLVVQVLVYVVVFQDLVVQVLVVVFPKTWLSKFWSMLFFSKTRLSKFWFTFLFSKTWLSEFWSMLFFPKTWLSKFWSMLCFQDLVVQVLVDLVFPRLGNVFSILWARQGPMEKPWPQQAVVNRLRSLIQILHTCFATTLFKRCTEHNGSVQLTFSSGRMRGLTSADGASALFFGGLGKICPNRDNMLGMMQILEFSCG